MTPRKVSILGAGNVAHHLVQAFVKNSIEIVQIFNRTEESALPLCHASGAEYVNQLKDLEPVEVIFIAVSDNAISNIVEGLPFFEKSIVVHTSGSAAIDKLKSCPKHGVFYPLQSFSKNRVINFQEVPIFITSDQTDTRNILLQLAKAISNKPIIIGDAKRSTLHIPAVIVNNFTNHLFAQARDLCDQNKLDFTLLLPLIKETIKRLEDGSHPKNHQTGPAIRDDQNTIKKHQQKLADSPSKLKLYNYITESIEEYYK